jgi:hypothetical protein
MSDSGEFQLAELLSPEDVERLYGAPPLVVATPAIPAPAPSTTPRLLTPEEVEKEYGGTHETGGKLVAQVPQSQAKVTGYLPMVTTAVTRGLTENLAPIDWYNRGAVALANRFGGRTQEDIAAARVSPDARLNEGSVVKGAQRVLGEVSPNLDPGRWQARDESERIAHEALTAGVNVVGPYGAGRAISKIPAVAKAGELLTAGGLPGQVIPSAVGGAVGEYSQNTPIGRTGGELAGAVGGGLVHGVGGALARPFAQYIAPMGIPIFNPKDPLTGLRSSQENVAGRALLEAGGSRAAADRLTPSPTALSQSTPTIDEQAAQFAPFAKYLEQLHPQRFAAATGRRQEARMDDLTTGTTPIGPTTDPGQAFRRLHTLENTPNQAELALQQSAQRAATGVQPSGTAAAAEQGMGQALQTQHALAIQDQIDKAAEITKQITGRVPGRPSGMAMDYMNSVQKLDANGLPTGELDLAKHTKWMKDNDANLTDALRQRLQNVPQLQQDLKDIMTHQAELRKAFPADPGGPYNQIGARFFKPDTDKNASKLAGDFNRLTADDPAAADHLFDYALNDFRKTKNAFNPDGTVNHDALKEWMDGHQGFLGQMPPNLVQRLHDARSAQTLFDAQTAVRNQAVADYERSVARLWLGKDTPTQRFDKLLGATDPVAEIKDVKSKFSNNPDAWNGFKREFIDYGSSKFVQTAADGTQTIKPKEFTQFVNQNRDSIKEVYGNDGLKLFQSLSDDFQSQARAESRRAATTAAAPSILQEGRVGRAVKGMAHATEWPWLVGGGSLGWWLLGPEIGAAAGIGGSMALKHAALVVADRMHANGMNKITDRLAMLANDPAAARLAMLKVPEDPNKLAVMISRIANVGQGMAGRENTRQLEEEYKKTGTYIPTVPMVGEVKR